MAKNEKAKNEMAKNEKTGAKAGTAASKVLRDPKASKAAKSAAGSALSQRPDRKKSGGKGRLARR